MTKSALPTFEADLRISPQAAIAVLALIGAVAGFVGEAVQLSLQGTLVMLLLGVLALAAWLLYRWRPHAGAWLTIAGFVVAVGVLDQLLPTANALPLLTVPTALAAALLGLSAALGTDILLTVLLIALALRSPGQGAPVTVTLLGLWAMYGVMVAVYRPVQRVGEWSWEHYCRAERLFAEARGRQGELNRTLKELAVANQHLTRLHALAQGLRHAAEEARRAKEQFVANVSHELRTPLNMIVGFAEMILQSPEVYGGQLPATLLADLDVILRNSRHLTSLIDDVLDLSQIEAGRMALSKERVALATVVEEATTVVRPLFESKGLTLAVVVPPDLPEILCDRTRIREVLVNLLSNAGRFTDRGGVEIRVQSTGDHVHLSVADTGPGIAAEDTHRVFRPFEQLDGSLQRRYGGSGLGLAISKSFVELHGGRMWFESEPGRGATFHFRLPVDPPLPLENPIGRWFNPYLPYEEQPHPSARSSSTVRPRFVVLESGGTLQRLLARYLDNAEIAAASDLEIALQELARMPSQALLVNDASVTEGLQQFLQMSPLPYGIPAIICSLPGIAEAAGALGADGYLVKPVTREELISAIDRVSPTGRTVLLVDDEPEALRLFRRMLGSTGRGYRVLRASSGRQALQILLAERPDIMLLDLVMPDMDGFQLLAAKSENPALRRIPTVVISARDPAGQPIVASALAVTRGGGLSTAQLLECIIGLTGLLSPAMPSAGATLQAVPRG